MWHGHIIVTSQRAPQVAPVAFTGVIVQEVVNTGALVAHAANYTGAPLQHMHLATSAPVFTVSTGNFMAAILLHVQWPHKHSSTERIYCLYN
jgi:fructosamine-3-kinase